MSVETINVPDLGGAESVEVIELCVASGDSVELEQSLIVLESDKATMDVPSPKAGVIKSLLVKEGDKVSEGTPMAEIETAAEGDDAPSHSDEEDTSEGDSGEASSESDADEPDGETDDAAPADKTGGQSEQTVSVPDTGTEEPLEIIELAVAEGDTVAEGDGLVVVETDKATMEIPSSCAGTVKQLLVAVGDKITSGDAIAVLAAEGGSGETTEDREEKAPAATAPESGAPETESQKKESKEKESPEKAPAEEASSEQEVRVPDTGGADAVEVIEIAAEAGAELQEGDGIVVVETDKATMELPAPFAGKLLEVLVKVGDKVSTGDVIARMAGAAPAESSTPTREEAPVEDGEPEPTAPTAPSPSEPAPTRPAKEESAGVEVYAGPASRALARELGVDLRNVTGTGPKGRILKEDLHDYVKQTVARAESGAGGSGIPAIPDVDFGKFGDIEKVPLQKIDKLTAANMQRSWLNAPHVTQFDEADITDLEDFRKSLKGEAEKRGSKLTPLPFLLKACAHALSANPEFNRSITADGEYFVQKKYVHIGMAVDTPRGLVVPVIRDVDRKGLWQLADEAGELAAKAREGKLTAAEMQGGCFTISSLGAIGGNGFTPIVNAPEAAILGVSRSQIKPVWNGNEFEPRLMLPLSVSYDHRIINGADCGRFFTYLVALLSDVRRLAL